MDYEQLKSLEGKRVKHKKYGTIYTVEWTNQNYGQTWTFHPIDDNGEPYEYYYGGWNPDDFEVL